MRKQTKIVAVASAAALLAIGASMTSFAATGWVEEDGQWYYYDKDGNRVEDEWKKSGDNWYWLDSEEGGAMAVDKLIEDDDDTYYVDSNGVMVKNTWVKVVNEDQDEDDDPAEYRYYYMQSNGKAYTAADDGETSFKTIDGKKYAFDEDGKMLYGWVKEDDATLATDDSDWEECTYYLGDWNDGALKTGWQKLTVYDQEEDEDMDYWFNFKSNGKIRKNVEEKKINGKYYRFDERGVMVYEWALASGSDGASVSDWMYFSNPEDGARKTKGWFKVVAPDDDNDNTFLDYDVTGFAPGDADDEEERWYYADGDGELYQGQIKKIKGKYYGFYPEGTDKAGSMLNGLCALITQGDEIIKVIERDMDADDLEDCMDGEGIYAEMYGELEDGQVASLYYFGNNEDEDGSMKTGATTVSLDGESYSFYFDKSGGAESKGKGLTGIDDEKYIYKFGLKMKADSDDKYKVVYATGDTGSDGVVVEEIDSAKMRKLAEEANGKNKDDETVKYVGTLGTLDEDGKVDSDFYLVNTSGSIVKNKTAAKDGDDWYFYVDEKVIKMYTNNKTLGVDSGDDPLTDTQGVKLKDEWDAENTVITSQDAEITVDDIKDRD